MAWIYAGRLGDNSGAPPMIEAYAGTGGCTAGVPVKWSGASATSTFVALAADTDQIAAVPVQTLVTNAKGLFILTYPDVLWRVGKKSATTPLAGTKVTVDYGTAEPAKCNITDTTTSGTVRIIRADPDDTTKWIVATGVI